MNKLIFIFFISFLFLGCINPITESGLVVAKFTEPPYTYRYHSTYGSIKQMEISEKYFFCLQYKVNGMIHTDIVETNQKDYNAIQLNSFYYNITGEPQ